MPPVPTPMSTIAAPPSSSTGVGGPSSPSSKLGAATVLASVSSAGSSSSSVLGSAALVSGASAEETSASPLPSVGAGPSDGSSPPPAGGSDSWVVTAAGSRGSSCASSFARARGLGGADDARGLAVLLEVGVDLREREVVAAQREVARDGSLLGRLGQDLVATVRRRERWQDEQRSGHGRGAQEAVSSPHGGESSGTAPRRGPVPRRTRPPRSPGTGRARPRPGWPGWPLPAAPARRSGRSGSRGSGCPRRS